MVEESKSTRPSHRPKAYTKSNNPYRGRPKKPENEKAVVVSLSIKTSILTKVEQKITGNNRSEKLVACIIEGFRNLTQ